MQAGPVSGWALRLPVLYFYNTATWVPVLMFVKLCYRIHRGA